MKTLFLLRHAKSSWAEPGTDDHDRALSPRGVRAAELVALYLAQRPVRPSFALCSTARRALDTLSPIRRHLGIPYRAERGLYLAEPGPLRERLARLEEPEANVLLVGHNPGLHELAEQLAGAGDRSARAQLRERFPTAALAVLQFEIEHWSEIAPGGGSLVELTTPADLV